MPFLSIPHSPLAARAATVHYREFGAGSPLVFLHSGWGYHIYPINRQLHALQDYRVLVPDRSGYGQSTHPAHFATDFHLRAAEETFLFLDALGVHDAIFWGHSDGSVIAALMALMHPERCRGVILEAFHFFRRKTVSQDFFRDMIEAPANFGPRVAAVLAHEHGEPYWQQLLEDEGRTWIDIGQLPDQGRGEDLYDGRFGQLRPPVALLHGEADPRTDPGEIEATVLALPSMTVELIANGGHCPHAESKAADAFTAALLRALAMIEAG